MITHNLQTTSTKTFTLADYTFTHRPSPTLCEAVQRRLDTLDPRFVLQVDGTRARILAPTVTHEPLSVMYDFVEAMKSHDPMFEWEKLLLRRRAATPHETDNELHDRLADLIPPGAYYTAEDLSSANSEQLDAMAAKLGTRRQ